MVTLNEYLKSAPKILSVIVIFTLVLSSCVDKISLPETLDPAQVHIECELSPPFHIKAVVATTGDLNITYNPYFPEDADLRLYSQIDEEFIFKYNPDKQLYEVLNGRLRKGFQYTLSAKLKDTSVNAIFASTVIPRASKLDSAEILSTEEFVLDNGSKEIHSKIKFYSNDQITDGTFYKLNLQFRVAKAFDNQGTSGLTYSSKLRDTKVISIDRGGAAIHPLYHMDGVLVDPSRLDENYFIVTVATEESLTESNWSIASVYTTLNTLSESYYRYHLALSKQLKIGGNNIIEPVIDYSNIENGLGYFGSFSSIRDSISVK